LLLLLLKRRLLCSAIFSVVTDLLFLLIIVVSLFWILLLVLFTCREKAVEKIFKENFFCLVFLWGCCKGSLCFFSLFLGGTEILGTGGSSLRASSSTSAGWDVVSAG
jgi:hypothetical protein